MEMQKIITERQDAHLRMTQYADGAAKTAKRGQAE